MARGSDPKSGSEMVEFAAYVAALTAELSRLARAHRLGTLAYLLDMTRLEARTLSNGAGPPEPPSG